MKRRNQARKEPGAPACAPLSLILLIVGVLSAAEEYPGKYILASLALPGAGELLKGQKARGEAFLWADAAIWVSYGAMTAVGSSRNVDAKLFARRYSGSSLKPRQDEYYVAVERYDNSTLYNDDIRREARELYPDTNPGSRARQEAYLKSHGYFGDLAWDWGSDSLRFDYWRQRKASRSLLHTAGFVLAGALIDRLASAIDVAFFIPLETRQAETRSRPNRLAGRFGALPASDRPGLALVYKF